MTENPVVELRKMIFEEGDLSPFLQKLSATSYGFALWRLPEAKDITLLIDLNAHNEERAFELESLSNCFVVNSYANNHPPKPLVMNGDLIIEGLPNVKEISVTPSISAGQLERFYKEIQQADHSKIRRSSLSRDKEINYEQLVSEAIRQIRNGEVQKIVLARYLDVDLGDDFTPYRLFEQLCDTYPAAFCYLTDVPGYGCWMGASPERLLSISADRIFKTGALAGTQILSKDQQLGEVAWRQKEIEEQALVSRYIINCFKKIRLREFEEHGPKTVRAGNLAHLKTEFLVDMVATNHLDLGSSMLNLLHPTSAVCGMPKDPAYQFIRDHEGFDRELFAGFLGPVNFRQSTHLFVNLRCMKIVGQAARLYAGAGITEDSHPERELKETNDKMQTLLNILQG